MDLGQHGAAPAPTAFLASFQAGAPLKSEESLLGVARSPEPLWGPGQRLPLVSAHSSSPGIHGPRRKLAAPCLLNAGARVPPSSGKVSPFLSSDPAGTRDATTWESCHESLRATSPGFLHRHIDFPLFWEPVSLWEEAEVPSLLVEPFQKERGVRTRPSTHRRGAPAFAWPGH